MQTTRLATLVGELRQITRRTGSLRRDDADLLGSLLALPVYTANDQADELVLRDIVEVVQELEAHDDRVIAKYLFRLADNDNDIGDRLASAADAIHVSGARHIRARENYVMAQVAFGLYARAMSPGRAGWHHGDGYIFTDFTIDAFIGAEMTTRTTRYSFSIQTVRDRVEFYKFGTTVRDARKTAPPRLLSESRAQQLIASVPVDRRNPTAGHWHVVRFNPKLPFRATPTVVLEEDTALLDPDDQMREVGCSLAGLDPVARELGIEPTVHLAVHLPLAAVSHYDRNVYSLVGDLMDRPLSSDYVERTNDTPLTFVPDAVEPGRRYVIDWSSTSSA